MILVDFRLAEGETKLMLVPAATHSIWLQHILTIYKTESYQGVSWVKLGPISFCCDGMLSNYLITKFLPELAYDIFMQLFIHV